jgi:hypothetical protein
MVDDHQPRAGLPSVIAKVLGRFGSFSWSHQLPFSSEQLPEITTISSTVTSSPKSTTEKATITGPNQGLDQSELITQNGLGRSTSTRAMPPPIAPSTVSTNEQITQQKQPKKKQNAQLNNQCTNTVPSEDDVTSKEDDYSILLRLLAPKGTQKAPRYTTINNTPNISYTPDMSQLSSYSSSESPEPEFETGKLYSLNERITCFGSLHNSPSNRNHSRQINPKQKTHKSEQNYSDLQGPRTPSFSGPNDQSSRLNGTTIEDGSDNTEAVSEENLPANLHSKRKLHWDYRDIQDITNTRKLDSKKRIKLSHHNLRIMPSDDEMEAPPIVDLTADGQQQKGLTRTNFMNIRDLLNDPESETGDMSLHESGPNQASDRETGRNRDTSVKGSCSDTQMGGELQEVNTEITGDKMDLKIDNVAIPISNNETSNNTKCIGASESDTSIQDSPQHTTTVHVDNDDSQNEQRMTSEPISNVSATSKEMNERMEISRQDEHTEQSFIPIQQDTTQNNNQQANSTPFWGRDPTPEEIEELDRVNNEFHYILAAIAKQERTSQ